MSFTKKQYTYDELCKLNSNGFSHANLAQTIDALSERFKELYGNDIDISSASADGQYVMGESYILYNIYTVLDSFYKNLNPNTASGSRLDILASFSNITRKQPSKSYAYLYVKRNGISTDTLQENKIIAYDTLGNKWEAQGSTVKYFKSTGNYTLLLKFECEIYGSTSAIGTHKSLAIGDTISDIFNTSKQYYFDGSGKVNTTDGIGSFKSIDSNYLIYQTTDAILGSTAETDEALRNRMAKERGLGAVTTLDSLQSALYEFDFVKDVKIINSPTISSGDKFDDDTPKQAHSFYVCIRYADGIDADNYLSEIGDTIWNYSTPGISSIATTSATKSGVGKSISKQTSKGDMTFSWKKCTAPSDTKIEITFSLASGRTLNDENKASILKSINQYIDNIKIGEAMSSVSLMNAMLSGDLKDNGLPVIFPTACTITNGTNYLSYFNTYTSSQATWTSTKLTLDLSQS